MADLSVQGFVDLSSMDLARRLSEEKEKMFGIQAIHAEERRGKGFFVRSFGRSSAKDQGTGASRQPTRSCQVGNETEGRKCKNAKSL
jgi:hypothetical protein